MTTSHSLPSSHTAGSVLDGDPRVLIPLPEAAERLGISRWQAYKRPTSGLPAALPTHGLPAVPLRCHLRQLTSRGSHDQLTPR